MSDPNLDRILKSVSPPERRAEFWEKLPKRISAKIEWRKSRAAIAGRESRRGGIIGWWLAAGALGCLVIGFGLGHWRGAADASAVVKNQKLVNEVLAMFPNQVRAIVQDENGLHLSLAEEANIPISTPLWIQICDGKRCQSVVTFSGQTVQIAGKKIEVLAESGGGVMLVGEQFFWSSERANPVGKVQIKAQALGQI